MTDEAALERLLTQRDGVPPIDDVPASEDPGDDPGDLELDEEE